MEYRDHIGDILKKEDPIDQLPGAGKPLSKEYLTGDVFQHFQRVARENGYLPEWIRLQHRIRDAFDTCSFPDDLVELNEMIIQFNKICPTPFQKPLLSMENIHIQKAKWSNEHLPNHR